MKPLRHALLIGLGIQGGGAATARYLAPRVTKLTITDLKTRDQLINSIESLAEFTNIEYILGGHERAPFNDVDLIIVGPSVKRDMTQLVEARKRGISVMGEIELFFSINKIPVIGITGTRGKTTTTMLMHSVLEKAGYKVGLGGNIPEKSALSLLDKTFDWIVLELSSWQLSDLHNLKMSPHVAIFTNFYPDHLNYYKTMDEYFYDKSAIFKYQKENDICVASNQVPSIKEALVISGSEYKGQLQLVGEHNRTNASLVYAASQKLGIPEATITSAISSFRGVAYRLEKIATVRGVDIYNDTTSTTPIAGIRAIEGLKPLYKNLYLIAGGNDKNLPYEDWINTVNSLTTGVVFLVGSMSLKTIQKIKTTKLLRTNAFENITEAYKVVMEKAQTGDVVVFSPAATSFATFKNEFDRGDRFNACVRDTIV